MIAYVLKNNLVRRIIEKVTVHDDRFTIEFKSGVKIDV